VHTGEPTPPSHERPTAGAQDRIAHNESVFRDVNERIADGRWPGEADAAVAFRCECGSLRCNQLLEVTLAVYERVRADPRHFLLLPGHEIPGVEVVIGGGDGYTVVEKVGVAGEVAEATDPR
jgi:hypothetical protein